MGKAVQAVTEGKKKTLPLCRCPRCASSTAPRGCICQEGNWGDSPPWRGSPHSETSLQRDAAVTEVLLPSSYCSALQQHFPRFPFPALGWLLWDFVVLLRPSLGARCPRGAAGHPSGLVPWPLVALALLVSPSSVRGTRWLLLAAGMVLEPAQQSLLGLSCCPSSASSVSPLRLAPALHPLRGT